MKKVLILLSLLSVMLISCERDKINEAEKPNDEKSSFPGPIPNEDQVMITLANMSYVGLRNPDIIEDSLRLVLANPKYITNNEWELSWFSFNKKKSILMFVVRHKTESNTYALCARGTNFSSLNNLLYDIDVFTTSDWPYGTPSVPDVKIARGSLNILNAILENEGQAFYPTAETISLAAYIDKILKKKEDSETNRLYITGHSLGGTIATILSTYILDELLKIDQNNDRTIYAGIYTFAASATGNKAYSNYVNQLIANHQKQIEGSTFISYRRYYITTDIVPVCLYADIGALATIGYPLTPLFTVEIKTIAGLLNKPLVDKGIYYFHVGSQENATAIPLDITKLPFPPPNLPQKVNSIKLYSDWVKYNHKHNFYGVLIGGDPIP